MPKRSQKTGYACPASYEPEGKCTGFMYVETTRRPGNRIARRYRICPRCGARERTKEVPDQPFWQPTIPVYRRNQKPEEIEPVERCLTEFWRYLSEED